MTVEAKDIATVVAIFVGTITVGKAMWAIAEFFIGLQKGMKQLTDSVEKLTERFDEHHAHVTEGLADVRERLSGLESWRSVVEGEQ